MIEAVKDLRHAVARKRHLRALALAAAIAMFTLALGIGVSAATPPTHTVTKEIERHTMPEAFCKRLTLQKGCYEVSSITETVANNSPVAQLFVRSASAWQSCYGPVTLTQSYYAAGSNWIAIASGHMRFQVCGQGSYVELTSGPNCWVSTLPAWGGGVNYCASPASGTQRLEPTWAEENWYLFAYSWPWYHINNIQEYGVYFLGTSLWYSCADC